MTETAEHQTAPISGGTAPPPTVHSAPPGPGGRPSRLAQAALWVAIVAGVVFVVAIIFFSGFALGRHSGGGYHHHKKHDRDKAAIFRHPMMWPGAPAGPMGPGPWGPGMGPSGPGQPPTTGPAPSPTPRP